MLALTLLMCVPFVIPIEIRKLIRGHGRISIDGRQRVKRDYEQEDLNGAV